VKRRPTTQDITWLLDLARNKQLDLDPPYQRRSVWTRKDKQFFLDTIFRDYPSPAIFLHKSVSEGGDAMYHVVDGKQRLQTIIAFSQNEIRIAKDFGDTRLDGKKWSQLQGDHELKHKFWNYQITVEMVDSVEGGLINEVFDRLNRNARKLTRQELRHAQFEGWLIVRVEKEAQEEDWETLGIVTTARVRRMAETQFISELMLVVLEGAVLGFDQDELDNYYGKYDEPEESAINFSETKFVKNFNDVKSYLMKLETHQHVVTRHANTLTHFYTLWCVVALNISDLKARTATEVADRFAKFMKTVELLASQKDLEAFIKADKKNAYKVVLSYYNNARGASTDFRPREERYKVLKQALLG
jgi:hypothetical protein